MPTQKQLRAIPFLLAGDPLEEVARKARVSTRSLSDWLADEDFNKILSGYYDDRIADGLQKAGRKLAEAAEEAADELIRMMRESKRFPELHAKTILALLDRAQRIAEYRRPRKAPNET